MKIVLTALLLTLASATTASHARTCIYLASVAEQVIELRQNSVRTKDIRHSFPDYPHSFKIYKPDVLLLLIINDAFQVQVYEVPTEKLRAVYKFGNKWFEDCLTKKLKLNK